MATIIKVLLVLALGQCGGFAVAGEAPTVARPASLTVVLDDNFPPFTVRDASGQLQGLLKDRWQRWQELTGIAVDLRGMDWAKAQQVMREGGADVIDTISRTPAREPFYDFSAPYADLDVMLFFRDSLSGIVDAASARPFVVGVKDGDRCIDTLQEAGVEHLKRYPSYASLVAAAARNEVGVFCMNQRPADYLLAKAGVGKAFRHTAPMYTSQFHWAVKEGNTGLLQLVADGFARIPPADSRMLEEKWFGAQVQTTQTPYLRYAGLVLLGLLVVLLVMAVWGYAMRLTVRRKTAALDEERARFETLFQTLPDAVWLKDPSGVLLACNAAFERYRGMPASHMIGKADADLVDSRTAVGFRTRDAEAMVADGPIHYEEWLHFSTFGGPRLCQLTKTRMHDAAGRLLGVLGVARDITELHATQVALGERVKEQQCLYAVYRASENLQQPLSDLLRNVAEQLPAGWQYPEIAAARVEWAGQGFATADLGAAVAQLNAEIRIGLEAGGRVTVAYLEERPPAHEGPFLAEERELIDAVAERLASIIQRREAEERLRDSEERFRKLFEDTRQPIMLVEDGRFIAANRASLAMLRMTSLEHFIGMTPPDISPEYQPDGRRSSEKVVEVVRVAFEEGTNEFEWEHIRADGEHFIARVLLTAIRLGHRDLLHVVWSDISPQKRAERELADYRQDLEHRVAERTRELATAAEALRLASVEQQAILDSATSGIVLVKDRIATRCNRRMHEILGWPAGGLIGRSTRAWYVDDADFESIGREVYTEIWHGLTPCREQVMARYDGTQLWTRMTGRAIDPADPSQGSVWVIDDITAERAALAEMTRARLLAEEAVRVKSDFLANMSHEIRTPMNAIIGMAHLALKTELTPRQRDYLKKIQGSSHHLLGIINDILDFSKIEAGKLVIEHIDFNLYDMIDNVTSLIAEKTAAKNLELIVQVADEVPPHLVGDPLRLGQVLVNYANNAVKFTERGEVAIRVAVVHRFDRELLLQFSVHDTGIGLSEEQRGRLFKSFEQADTSTTRKYGGTGLGLVIAKRLAELMGGEVGVDSTPGVGSTFWFTARLGCGEVKARSLQPATGLRGSRMLVVDDNDNAREVIGDMLRGMSFNVAVVPSGKAAVAEVDRAAAAGEPYAVALIDWQMPELDGIATAREIGRLALASPPRLVIITAYGRDELLKSAQEVGIEDVLIKPISASLLFDTLMNLLGGERREEAAADQAVAVKTIDLSTISGARVLLVEDNDLNQEVATELLQQEGFVVELAADGAIALDLVAQQSGPGQYDIVLMDMQMPVMDGVTATRAIRQLPGCADLPIVAMTANAMASDRERCLEAGMNDHLAKPIAPEDLWTKLLRWVKPRTGIGPGHRAPEPAAVPAPALPPARVSDLATIAGLDSAAGLRQSLGRETLYRSLLGKFVTGQRDFPARMAAAIAASDWATAERLAHTLKGVAAQIAAQELRGLAERLEHAIRRHEPAAGLETLLAEIAPRLTALIAAIAPCLPGEPAAPVAEQVDADQLREVCTRLVSQLQDDDFASEQWLKVHEGVLRAALGGHFPQIAAAIHDYDFATALDRLKEALAPHGIAL